MGPLEPQVEPLGQPMLRRSGAAELHESLAGLLAARGQYEAAYRHLRTALDMVRDMPRAVPHIPEQLRAEVAQLRREHAEAMQQSLRDALTGTYNRRYLDHKLLELVTEHRGDWPGLAVALVDLDWFKLVNDTYGHAIGDLVLQRVAELLQRELPDGAFCARYGGEEFVLVLPGTGLEPALGLAEAARRRIQRYDWSAIAAGLHLTVSIGLRHQDADAALDSERQLRSADRLLYTAKRAGRNATASSDGGPTAIRRDHGRVSTSG